MGSFNPAAWTGSIPPTVLLVEDEPKVRERVRSMLEDCSCAVLTADDPEQALKVHESTGKVDILITDVSLPNMNGVELCEKLRAAQPNLKVLFMSGFFEDVLEKCYGVSLASEEFLHKPFSAETLEERLTEILRPQ